MAHPRLLGAQATWHAARFLLAGACLDKVIAIAATLSTRHPIDV